MSTAQPPAAGAPPRPGAAILVVDDEPGVRAYCRDLLERQGHRVTEAASAAEAQALAGATPFDLVLADVNMPEVDGIELCRRLRRLDPDQAVVLITGFPSLENAIRGMKEGARDYVTKPFTPDALRLVVARALQERELTEENRRLRQEIQAQHGLDALVGGSAAMRALRAMVLRVARSDSTALILGESGTGKELVARAIHVHGRRGARPFVPVNCGSLVGSLLESELFGHVRGAFTGAHAAKPGLVEAAHRGTLFLDEVGELAPGMQPHLLRLLQEGEIRQVGAVATRRVDVRVVAATHRDLEADVRAGRFREDLFYRLNVVTVAIPPLRERREDIPLLVDHFLRRAAARARRRIEGITPAALEHLAEQPWPGNVRQLQNAIERAVILAAGPVIDVEDVGGDAAAGASEPPPPVAAPTPYVYRGLPMDEVERRHIAHVLRETGGNRSRAAEVLGINRTTLWKKLRRYEAAGAGPDGGEPEEAADP